MRNNCPLDADIQARLDAACAERQASLREVLDARFGGERSFVLEIGCGHGRWLTGYATAFPERICVGIDLVTKRIQLGEKKQQRRELDNLLFMKAECAEFLGALQPRWQLDDCFMLFPDPWPKKRHHKKRMVQDRFLALLKTVMSDGGRFHFRTDHEEYFAWTEDKVRAHEDWELDPAAAWPFEHSTFFQDMMPHYQSLIARPVLARGQDRLERSRQPCLVD